MFASAHLPDDACLGGNIAAGDIAAIARAVGAINRLAIKLGEQNVDNREEHGFRSAFQQVGDADVELSLAQANGVVDGYKGIETHVQSRRGRARAQFAIGIVKDFGKLGGHVDGRVAEAAISRQLSQKNIVELCCCGNL